MQRIADCSLKSGEYRLHGIEYTAEWTVQRENGDRWVQSPENKVQCTDRVSALNIAECRLESIAENSRSQDCENCRVLSTECRV